MRLSCGPQTALAKTQTDFISISNESRTAVYDVVFARAELL